VKHALQGILAVWALLVLSAAAGAGLPPKEPPAAVRDSPGR
jgi:hypothetical protein